MNSFPIIDVVVEVEVEELIKKSENFSKSYPSPLVDMLKSVYFKIHAY
jgi:hypothetical protein